MPVEGQELNTEPTTDELYDSINAPVESEIPMSAEPEGGAPEGDKTFKFTANGKEISATQEEVLKWASQGHDYSQKMQGLKTEREQFDTQFKSLSEIDEYAKANPEWFNHVQEAWKNKDGSDNEDQNLLDEFESDDSESDGIIDPEIQAIKEKTEKFDQFMTEFTAKENAKVRAEEDQLLDLEVKSHREQYPKLDWDKPDESGQALEGRILKHAQENGITKFKTAFRDYMHENLIKDAREEGKEAVSKDLAAKTKLGLLGTTPSPTKGLQGAANIKSKSYDDLLTEGLGELGIS